MNKCKNCDVTSNQENIYILENENYCTDCLMTKLAEKNVLVKIAVDANVFEIKL